MSSAVSEIVWQTPSVSGYSLLTLMQNHMAVLPNNRHLDDWVGDNQGGWYRKYAMTSSAADEGAAHPSRLSIGGCQQMPGS